MIELDYPEWAFTPKELRRLKRMVLALVMALVNWVWVQEAR